MRFQSKTPRRRLYAWGVTWFSLFESQRGVPDNKELKGYELKDSFMGGEEADLVMLTASHEEIP